MNNRERYVRTMHFQPVDRVPNWEDGPQEQTLQRWYGEGMPRGTDLERGSWCYYGSEFFELDRQGYVDVDMGFLPLFDPEVLWDDEKYEIKRSIHGFVSKALKRGFVRGQRISMDQYLEFPVKTREDWEKLKARLDPDSPARYPMWWDDKVRIWKDRDYPLHLPIVTAHMFNSFYGTFRSFMGTEMACTIFYDDPKWAEEMLEYIENFIVRSITRALNDVEIDAFMWFEDFAGKGGPLVGPNIVKKFFWERYRRINDLIRSKGCDVIFLDTDGDARILLPLLISAGMNGTYPTEVAAGMHPLELRAEYGHDLLIMGGIDKRTLIESKEATAAELLRTLPPLLADGGYIPTLDHQSPPEVSYDAWCYYLDLKRKIIEGRL